jgi:hypothetical protein
MLTTFMATQDKILSTLGTIENAITSLHTDVSALKTDVSALKTDVSALKTDVSALKTQTRLSFVFTFVACVVFYFFMLASTNNIHNMGSDRIGMLEKVSYQAKACGMSTTVVGVVYRGHQFGVTVAHHRCNGTCPGGLYHCAGLDIALQINECPASLNVVDASRYVEPRTGDEAFVYGLATATNVRSYRASIGSVYGAHVGGAAFDGVAILRPNSRYLMGGDQNAGFSGSGVLNGNGLIGIASATLSGSLNALMVPWGDVYSCIETAVASGLQLPTGCNSTVLVPPRLSGNWDPMGIVGRLRSWIQ